MEKMYISQEYYEFIHSCRGLYISIKGKYFHMCVYVYVLYIWEQTLQMTQNALFDKFQSE